MIALPRDYGGRWTLELARLRNACIHRFWRAGERVPAPAGVRLGETYPALTMDHARAPHRALAAHEMSK